MPNNDKCVAYSKKYENLRTDSLRFRAIYRDKDNRTEAMGLIMTIKRDFYFLKSKLYKIGLGNARDFIIEAKLKRTYPRGAELSMLRDGMDVEMLFSDYFGSAYWFALFKKNSKLYIMTGTSENITDADEASGFVVETRPLRWLEKHSSTPFSFDNTDEVSYFLRRIPELRRKISPSQQKKLMQSLGVSPTDVAWENLFEN